MMVLYSAPRLPLMRCCGRCVQRPYYLLSSVRLRTMRYAVARLGGCVGTFILRKGSLPPSPERAKYTNDGRSPSPHRSSRPSPPRRAAPRPARSSRKLPTAESFFRSKSLPSKKLRKQLSRHYPGSGWRSYRLPGLCLMSRGESIYLLRWIE